MTATKLVLTGKHLMYKERLLQLKLPTLKYRHLRRDMTEVLKILTGKYDTNVTFSFEKHQDCSPRGHNLKLVNHICHDLRKYFFCTQIINTWNSLPESVISASTTDSFKNKLDKFWNNQDLLYNYQAQLTEIGSRSFISNFD